PDPYAISAYGALALSRIFKTWPAVVWQFEAVLSRDWADVALNPELQRLFLSDAATVSSAQNANSLGALSILQIPLAEHLQLLYKFDYLDLNSHAAATTFT